MITTSVATKAVGAGTGGELVVTWEVVSLEATVAVTAIAIERAEERELNRNSFDISSWLILKSLA